MVLVKGNIVRFKRTGDEGIVTKIMGEGMVTIRLKSDGMLIPAFIDDLEKVEPVARSPHYKAKVIKRPQKPEPKEPERPKPKTQYHILDSKGIQLAFDPITNKEGQTLKYDLYLINDTPYDALFTFKLTLGHGEDPIIDLNGKINGTSTFELGEMLFDELNEHPSIETECWQLSTVGRGERLEHHLKIKPKQFFKKITTAPFLNRTAHLYILFPSLEKNKEEETSAEDLKTYTQRKAVLRQDQLDDLEHYSLYDLEAIADFKPEIDLHIEALVEDPKKVAKKDIVKTQLSHFERYLEKAIEYGLKRVFIIHGVGEGKLKNEISSRLLLNEHVETFRNEYHPHYGYGATEVIFK